MTDTISTLEEARWFARQWLNESTIDTEATAAFITLLAKRYQDVGPSRYARYLLSVAFREALLPTGWNEPPAISEEWVPGLRTLLDTQGDSSHAWAQNALDLFAAAWPSEEQVNDWNIHNDHADGIEEELGDGE